MTRGKHQKRASAKRSRAVASKRESLEAELAAETEQIASLQPRLARLARDRVELAGLADERDRSVLGELRRLDRLADEYRIHIEREEAIEAQVKEIWQAVVDTAIVLVGADIQAFEDVARLLGFLGESGMLSDGNPYDSRLSRRNIASVQRARGHRREIPTDLEELDEPYRLPPSVRARVEADPQLRTRAVGLSRQIARSHPFHRDRNTVAGWTFQQIVGPNADADDPWGEVLSHLGAVGDDVDAWLSAATSADPTEGLAAQLAQRDPLLVKAAGRWVTSTQARSLFPRPQDAIAARWWYWHSASGTELRHEESSGSRFR